MHRGAPILRLSNVVYIHEMRRPSDCDSGWTVPDARCQPSASCVIIIGSSSTIQTSREERPVASVVIAVGADELYL
ncbi:hypothetical protein Trydic_g18486 [Trypoxylus dichotomus]